MNDIALPWIRPARWVRAVLAAGMAVSLITGCQFGGLNSLDMPGTVGHGAGAFTITVELPDVSTLPQNSPVMVDDVTVGSVSGQQVRLRADGTFYAALELSLSPAVKLPANATVTVGQTSLLGSQHVELAAPTLEAAEGELSNGATIPIERAGRYPNTEEVLSSLGIVVNKGNLGAVQDITDELYSAVAGRAGQFADFLPRLSELTNSLNQQSGDIITAIEAVNRVTGKFAQHSAQLSEVFDTIPEALRVLNGNGAQFVETFAALHRFAEISARILGQTKADFAADLSHAYAVVKPLNESSQQLIDALPILATYPFPQSGIKQAVRGDYLNAIATLDLTVRRFGENVFTTSGLDPNMKHLSEILTAPDYLIGAEASLSGQAADPFKFPPMQSVPPASSTGHR